MSENSPTTPDRANLERLFEKLFEFSPDAVFVVDAAGAIVRTNARAEQLFGYDRRDLVGLRVEMLVPQRFRPQHPGHRSGYAGQPHIRPMGAGLDLYGLKKDGSEFPVDIMLSPIELNGDSFVVAVVRDVTRRKLAEQERDRQAAIARDQADLLDLAHDSIIMRDLNNRITFWNKGAEDRYGWKREEALGQFAHTFLQTWFPQPVEEIDEALRRHHYWEGEVIHTAKDGTKIVASSRRVLQRDAAGKPKAILEINNDITRRKQAEENLKRSEGRLRALFEFSPDAILVIDQAGKITEVNAQVESFFGYSRGELLGENVEKLIPERFRTTHPAHRKEYAAHPRVRAMGAGLELYARRKDGTEFPVDIMLGPVPGVEGAAVLAVIRDLTQKKRDEEALRRGELERRYLEEELQTDYRFEEIIGESRALRRVLKQVETVAKEEATVLILGETGTGKELIARAIHELSPRRERTFVKLNCSAIPAGLLESELFGHEKGAFTGALAQKIGRLELANEGTLFLDEIGDLPLDLQPKILRALQEREFDRLGGTKTIPVNVRLIAATNRNLAKMVASHEFRSDLYYRLRVFPIEIPPLRERREDISVLVNYFVHKHSRRMNRQIATVPLETMEILRNWSWPGNVRELENFMERAVILTQGPILRAPLTELKAADADDPASDLDPNLENAEREHILRVLRDAKGTIGGPDGAAEKLGLKRTTLNSKMKKLGIKRKDYI